MKKILVALVALFSFHSAQALPVAFAECKINQIFDSSITSYFAGAELSLYQGMAAPMKSTGRANSSEIYVMGNNNPMLTGGTIGVFNFNEAKFIDSGSRKTFVLTSSNDPKYFLVHVDTQTNIPGWVGWYQGGLAVQTGTGETKLIAHLFCKLDRADLLK